MYQICILYLSFTFILYIHYTLTCTSILELLLIDTIGKNLIKKMDKKTVMRFLTHHSFILVKFNFYEFTFTYLNDHAVF